MSYGYVYVATVAMGADPAQLLKALNEAEAYKGPSLIIAYAPCINHGINMGMAQAEIKKAVAAGYWPLYRYNPDLENPLTVDSKDPTASYQDSVSYTHLMGYACAPRPLAQVMCKIHQFTMLCLSLIHI